MKRSIVLFALAALLGTCPAAFAGEARHSGTVVSVDADGRGFTLEEMGPWQGPGTGLVRRHMRLGPDTAVRLVKRMEDIERAAWPVTFESTPLDPSALQPGAF